MENCSREHPDNYGYYIQKLAKNIKYLADENLIAHKITFEQVKVLKFLEPYNGESPANQKDIEVRFELKRSSVTSILQNMERSGLVSRSGDASDGRVKRVWLTEKGRELSLFLRDYINKIEQVIVSDMTEEEKAFFKQLLKRSIQNVEMFAGK
ncbi:MarR family winged helix-turn-helix transcriptional regulator [Anaerocolumna xylanovorans]|uniref:DNA-binding transcriptional regulator, MarR family n=1 Tax=Anaerocolumna xylanovorans DSM 12503 TaxID=1121345 RepID=A0A1M7Y3G7_9FIRM|nr:MarR family transcriptional regulator [Anaerocolumna xylanovorans]SHO46731.1 DNA-binding transcriptional regulator, MarR family [Anaerocolumna xylanovorans DSM 12503]